MSGTRAKPAPRVRPVNNAARERSRVQSLRAAFSELQKSLPSVPPDTKLSKLDVLVLATAYIYHLTTTLQHHRNQQQQHQQHSLKGQERDTTTMAKYSSDVKLGMEPEVDGGVAHVSPPSERCNRCESHQEPVLGAQHGHIMLRQAQGRRSVHGYQYQTDINASQSNMLPQTTADLNHHLTSRLPLRQPQHVHSSTLESFGAKTSDPSLPSTSLPRRADLGTSRLCLKNYGCCCSDCEKDLNVSVHQSTSTPSSRKYGCSDCERDLNVSVHQSTSGARNYGCSDCEKDLNVSVHQSTSTPSSRKYGCSDCEKDLNVSVHQSTSTPSSRKYGCSDCERDMNVSVHQSASGSSSGLNSTAFDQNVLNLDKAADPQRPTYHCTTLDDNKPKFLRRRSGSLGIMHPVKKWPMRCRLYQQILGCLPTP